MIRHGKVVLKKRKFMVHSSRMPLSHFTRDSFQCAKKIFIFRESPTDPALIKATRALFLQVNRYDISVLAIQLCCYSAKLLYTDFSCRHQFQSSKKLAEDGQLILLTAGDRSPFDTVAPFSNIGGKEGASPFSSQAPTFGLSFGTSKSLQKSDILVASMLQSPDRMIIRGAEISKVRNIRRGHGPIQYLLWTRQFASEAAGSTGPIESLQTRRAPSPFNKGKNGQG
ncbi:hypothetical protein RHMOL_Rhmol11G0277500 [Rhododendron molle]|uniref:Uncharacterized protein n=1 Tax=Rhododendron molle TaxID=49168 RepID=A0ACC0LWT3_RHOML|nr:hypothetical protein RHMOL_Rhmol11G0277500 [Rhododendron molle]